MGHPGGHAVRGPRADGRRGVLRRRVRRRLLRVRADVRRAAAAEPRSQPGDRHGGGRLRAGGALGHGQRHHQLLGEHRRHLRDKGEATWKNVSSVPLSTWKFPQVGSLRVVQTCGFIILLVGLVCKFGAVIIAIPEPIIGGILVSYQNSMKRASNDFSIMCFR